MAFCLKTKLSSNKLITQGNEKIFAKLFEPIHLYFWMLKRYLLHILINIFGTVTGTHFLQTNLGIYKKIVDTLDDFRSLISCCRLHLFGGNV